MKTLDQIWTDASIKLIPVISEDGRCVLIEAQANNGWYLGKMMGQKDNYYMMDFSMILLKGNEQIWIEL